MAVRALFRKNLYFVKCGMPPKFCTYPANDDEFSSQLETKERSQKPFQSFLNEVKLIGFVKNTPKNIGINLSTVTHFSLGTHRFFLRNSDMVRETSWHNIIIRKQQLQEYAYTNLLKGSKVYVSGFIWYKSCDEFFCRAQCCIVADQLICVKKYARARSTNDDSESSQSDTDERQ